MKENQLLGTFLAKEGLNLLGKKACAQLSVLGVGSVPAVSCNGRGVVRRCLRKPGDFVTCAYPLFMAESTNPFSEPMAPWSFDFSHAVASAIIVCVPCLVQGFFDSLEKMHCTQQPHAEGQPHTEGHSGLLQVVAGWFEQPSGGAGADITSRVIGVDPR